MFLLVALVGNGVVVPRGIQEFCVGLILNGPTTPIQVQKKTACMWQATAQKQY